jgi:hypothetical protein
MTDLALTPVSKRITIVSSVGTPADGDSLAGQNVNNFPEGALFFVESSSRFYALRKNVNAAVVATPANNVVDGVGSSAEAGRFVALMQLRSAVLTAGSATGITGFDVSRVNGFFIITLVTPGGTPGFVHATITAPNTVSLTSSNGADTGTYSVVYVG